MPTGAETWFDNDGKSVHVDLEYAVDAMQVAVVDGWLGITVEEGESGDTIALTADERAYQFTVPAGLTVNKGDVVYIELADLTGHTPDDTAYSTSPGAGKRALFRAQEDKDGNNVVRGRLLSGVATNS